MNNHNSVEIEERKGEKDIVIALNGDVNGVIDDVNNNNNNNNLLSIKKKKEAFDKKSNEGENGNNSIVTIVPSLPLTPINLSKITASSRAIAVDHIKVYVHLSSSNKESNALKIENDIFLDKNNRRNSLNNTNNDVDSAVVSEECLSASSSFVSPSFCEGSFINNTESSAVKEIDLIYNCTKGIAYRLSLKDYSDNNTNNNAHNAASGFNYRLLGSQQLLQHNQKIHSRDKKPERKKQNTYHFYKSDKEVNFTHIYGPEVSSSTANEEILSSMFQKLKLGFCDLCLICYEQQKKPPQKLKNDACIANINDDSGGGSNTLSAILKASIEKFFNTIEEKDAEFSVSSVNFFHNFFVEISFIGIFPGDNFIVDLLSLTSSNTMLSHFLASTLDLSTNYSPFDINNDGNSGGNSNKKPDKNNEKNKRRFNEDEAAYDNTSDIDDNYYNNLYNYNNDYDVGRFNNRANLDKINVRNFSLLPNLSIGKLYNGYYSVRPFILTKTASNAIEMVEKAIIALSNIKNLNTLHNKENNAFVNNNNGCSNNTNNKGNSGNLKSNLRNVNGNDINCNINSNNNVSSGSSFVLLFSIRGKTFINGQLMQVPQFSVIYLSEDNIFGSSSSSSSKNNSSSSSGHPLRPSMCQEDNLSKIFSYLSAFSSIFASTTASLNANNNNLDLNNNNSNNNVCMGDSIYHDSVGNINNNSNNIGNNSVRNFDRTSRLQLPQPSSTSFSSSQQLQNKTSFIGVISNSCSPINNSGITKLNLYNTRTVQTPTSTRASIDGGGCKRNSSTVMMALDGTSLINPNNLYNYCSSFNNYLSSTSGSVLDPYLKPILSSSYVMVYSILPLPDKNLYDPSIINGLAWTSTIATAVPLNGADCSNDLNSIINGNNNNNNNPDVAGNSPFQLPHNSTLPSRSSSFLKTNNNNLINGGNTNCGCSYTSFFTVLPRVNTRKRLENHLMLSMPSLLSVINNYYNNINTVSNNNNNNNSSSGGGRNSYLKDAKLGVNVNNNDINSKNNNNLERLCPSSFSTDLALLLFSPYTGKLLKSPSTVTHINTYRAISGRRESDDGGTNCGHPSINPTYSAFSSSFASASVTAPPLSPISSLSPLSSSNSASSHVIVDSKDIGGGSSGNNDNILLSGKKSVNMNANSISNNNSDNHAIYNSGSTGGNGNKALFLFINSNLSNGDNNNCGNRSSYPSFMTLLSSFVTLIIYHTVRKEITREIYILGNCLDDLGPCLKTSRKEKVVSGRINKKEKNNVYKEKENEDYATGTVNCINSNNNNVNINDDIINKDDLNSNNKPQLHVRTHSQRMTARGLRRSNISNINNFNNITNINKEVISYYQQMLFDREKELKELDKNALNYFNFNHFSGGGINNNNYLNASVNLSSKNPANNSMNGNSLISPGSSNSSPVNYRYNFLNTNNNNFNLQNYYLSCSNSVTPEISPHEINIVSTPTEAFCDTNNNSTPSSASRPSLPYNNFNCTNTNFNSSPSPSFNVSNLLFPLFSVDFYSISRWITENVLERVYMKDSLLLLIRDTSRSKNIFNNNNNCNSLNVKGGTDCSANIVYNKQNSMSVNIDSTKKSSFSSSNASHNSHPSSNSTYNSSSLNKSHNNNSNNNKKPISVASIFNKMASSATKSTSDGSISNTIGGITSGRSAKNVVDNNNSFTRNTSFSSQSLSQQLQQGALVPVKNNNNNLDNNSSSPFLSNNASNTYSIPCPSPSPYYSELLYNYFIYLERLAELCYSGNGVSGGGGGLLGGLNSSNNRANLVIDKLQQALKSSNNKLSEAKRKILDDESLLKSSSTILSEKNEEIFSLKSKIEELELSLCKERNDKWIKDDVLSLCRHSAERGKAYEQVKKQLEEYISIAEAAQSRLTSVEKELELSELEREKVTNQLKQKTLVLDKIYRKVLTPMQRGQLTNVYLNNNDSSTTTVVEGGGDIESTRGSITNNSYGFFNGNSCNNNNNNNNNVLNTSNTCNNNLTQSLGVTGTSTIRTETEGYGEGSSRLEAGFVCDSIQRGNGGSSISSLSNSNINSSSSRESLVEKFRVDINGQECPQFGVTKSLSSEPVDTVVIPSSLESPLINRVKNDAMADDTKMRQTVPYLYPTKLISLTDPGDEQNRGGINFNDNPGGVCDGVDGSNNNNTGVTVQSTNTGAKRNNVLKLTEDNNVFDTNDLNDNKNNSSRSDEDHSFFSAPVSRLPSASLKNTSHSLLLYSTVIGTSSEIGDNRELTEVVDETGSDKSSRNFLTTSSLPTPPLPPIYPASKPESPPRTSLEAASVVHNSAFYNCSEDKFTVSLADLVELKSKVSSLQAEISSLKSSINQKEVLVKEISDLLSLTQEALNIRDAEFKSALILEEDLRQRNEMLELQIDALYNELDTHDDRYKSTIKYVKQAELEWQKKYKEISEGYEEKIRELTVAKGS